MRFASSIALLVCAPGLAAQQARPLPYPVDVPHAFQAAIANGTRTAAGAPGPEYWQNWSAYALRARVDPAAKQVSGTARIVYYNRSPYALPGVGLQLIQNFHQAGAIRNRTTEVTGGMTLSAVRADGIPVPEAADRAAAGGAAYQVMGTTLGIQLARPLVPGDSVTLELDYAFRIAQIGAGGRMGWSRDNLIYLAYWYPQMAVFDDVNGWQLDPFLGNAEFYMDYGRYDVTLEVPTGWVVMGTGTLVNADSVLAPAALARLRAAERSDTVVHVLTEADLDRATRGAPGGTLAWHFVADSVRDVAYSVSRRSRWDAARTPVGDRNGDGMEDFVRVDAIYRASAPRWTKSWRYAQHSIAFLSRWTGYPYPWPHMTAVEGEDIIGGGMEYPMMTLISSYTASSDTGLYSVTSHELAHMWLPMIVGNDERRRAWMDEGTTSFNSGAAHNDFFPGKRSELGNYDGYTTFAQTDDEDPIITWSDAHRTRDAYSYASYAKPATVLWTLRGLLGSEVFGRAFQAYVHRWAFKHPQPWDLFNTFNDVAGRNLDWFWRTWYYETWTLDQAVSAVRGTPTGSVITVEDLGLAPMPTRLTVTFADGRRTMEEIPVERWLSGARRAEVSVTGASPVVRVEIDAERVFPDVDRTNNVWVRK